jgi:tape measure domain-containing protein
MGLIGNLLVKLGINTSQFTSGLNQAARAADKFSNSLSSSFKRTATASKKAGNSMNLFAKQGGSSLKDVSRITQGIIISQTFYKITGSIREAISALNDFSLQAEQSQASFALLLKDAAKAERFNSAIEDFAAATPYTYDQAAKQARKLLAYGFRAEGLIPIMNTLADASAASGDAESFDRIGKALGQIYTKGRLAQQELLQLTEAGIPAFEILREKLNLTQEELSEIGRQGISANTAIRAILEGIQERYGGASDVISNTLSGMISTIKDNALIISKTAFEPFYNSLKGIVRRIRNATDNIREIVRTSGIGGLVKTMVPPELYPQIQLLAANFRMFAQNIKIAWQALQPFISALSQGMLTVFNVIMPIFNAVVRILAVLGQMFSSSSARVKAFVGALGGLFITVTVIKLLMNLTAVLKGLFIVKVVAQGVLFLANAIRVLSIAIVKNPLVAVLGVAAGALLYFGLTSKKVSGWISGVGSSISKAFGVDPSKEFVPKMNKNKEITDEFNQGLETSAEKLDDMGDSAKKAGKKAKEALMSFDEVFNLTDPDESGADGLDAGLDGLSIGDVTIPEIGGIGDIGTDNLDSPIQDWVDTFKDKLLTKLKNTLVGAGIGAAIGAIIGGLLGGPAGALLGAKIGAVGGGIAGMFWDMLPKEFQNAAKGAGIAGAIGGAIGFAFGGPAGAAIGAAIGVLAGSIVGYFWDNIIAFFSKKDTKQGMAGAAIGAAIGSLFGPVGTVLGAIIGAIIGKNWDAISNWFVKTSTSIKAWRDEMWGTLSSWWNDSATGFSNWTKDTSKSVYDWCQATWTELSGWWTDSAAGFKIWMDGTKEGFRNWNLETLSGIVTWIKDAASRFTTWWGDTKTGFGNWWSDTKSGFSDWWSGIKSGNAIWSADTLKSFGNWISDSTSRFTGWWKDTNRGFGTWISDTGSKIGTWAGDTISKFTTWASKTWSSVSNWYINTVSKFDNWRNNTNKGFADWWRNSVKGFGDWAKNSYEAVVGWFDEMAKKLGNFFEKLAFWKKDAEKAPNITYTNYNAGRTGASSLSGHATGGIFNKEHIARFAEGNKAEAVIPLENAGAMQPFVDAVANGVSASMGSIVAQMGNAFATPTGTPTMDDRPILYVGTLIADDRSLRELERKMQVIRTGEQRRRG